MAEKPLTREQILAIIADTPARIAALTAGLPPARLMAVPLEGGWPVNAVLAHLRSCADVWGDYIQRILTQDNPVIRAVSPRTYIHQTDYPNQDFAPSLQAFTAQRAALLDVLRALPPEDWSCKAIVTGAGKPYQRTVSNYGERMARHEREHLRQIEKICDPMRNAA